MHLLRSAYNEWIHVTALLVGIWMAMETARSWSGVAATFSHRHQPRPPSTRGSLHSLPRVLLFMLQQNGASSWGALCIMLA